MNEIENLYTFIDGLTYDNERYRLFPMSGTIYDRVDNELHLAYLLDGLFSGTPITPSIMANTYTTKLNEDYKAYLQMLKNYVEH